MTEIFRLPSEMGLNFGTLVATPCQVSRVVQSAIGLVSLVSVYCDRMRQFHPQRLFLCGGT